MLCQVEDGIEMQVVENWSSASVEIDGSARKIDKKQAPAGKLPLTEPEKMELEIRVFAIWIAEKRSLVAQLI